MALQDRLTEDLKKATKARDKSRLSAIRMIRAAIKNLEIARKKELDDQGVLEVLSSLAKQRKESIEQFRKGGREDLACKEEEELQIISSYLPPQLSYEAIQARVKQSIRETEAASPKDFGKVMKVLMPQLKGQADGKMVGEIVKEELAAL
ncbi:MAG: GatB/YqeY domain-containing protein [Deltaproteobacteria bacterium]|nr:GatB/YqeY domain-containing protein [Deltaproteobacteria bacterium]MBW2306570.1 GatB/YqeY domain-containing protein [Deltaproteobacteria bacterium]